MIVKLQLTRKWNSTSVAGGEPTTGGSKTKSILGKLRDLRNLKKSMPEDEQRFRRRMQELLNMGFNSVYRSLQEVFPQVDLRILKAVAIEHSKDADAAVEFILLEVVPSMSRLAEAPCSPSKNQDVDDISVGANERQHVGCVAEPEEQIYLLKHQHVVEEANASPPSPRSIACENANNTSHTPRSIACEDANNTSHINTALYVNSTYLDEGMSSSSVSNRNDANDNCDLLCENTEAEELISLLKHQESSVTVVSEDSEQSSHVASNSLIHEDALVTSSLSNVLHPDFQDLKGPVAYGSNSGKESHEYPSCFDSNSLEAGKSPDTVQLDPSSVHEGTPDASECGLLLEKDTSNSVSECEKRGPSGSSETASEHEFFITNVEDESTSTIMVTQSDQICRIDLLEDSIGDAKNYKQSLVASSTMEAKYVACYEAAQQAIWMKNFISKLKIVDSIERPIKVHCDNAAVVQYVKNNHVTSKNKRQFSNTNFQTMMQKTLFSAMESVINMMREVELLEKDAEQAKVEASRGGLDILVRVEELKQMLQHAKEANDVHAGDIYGEKAILATEVRELQSRLLNLSDERDKSLAILFEMRQTLEGRLAAAEEERKAAEQEKLGKEESGLKALAEQELIMEKVVKESKKLQQAAEENSKLREFLMDRGQIVDILQGEIDAVCQDIKLLNEKFDERVLLSKSVSSIKTSSILASSSSSFNSMASDRVTEQAESSETLNKANPKPLINDESQKSSPEDEGVGDDSKAISDDDWEWFNDEPELSNQSPAPLI
ncbi:hypothetical protein HHK36_020668 [Tetracentron sinense]|uniref:CUE domain-containing protein n=1 Tax=Tetracentron sinense TaxID=13715 RepID=A0A834YUE7_TETSI|nr:hypothetical protein HHK36_020668 [Tetracentron sinense]